MSKYGLIDFGWFGHNNPGENDWRRLREKLDVFEGGKIPDDQKGPVIQKLLQHNSFARSLFLLERVFEYDKLFIDGVALGERPHFVVPSELKDVFEVHNPDIEIYNQTGRALTDFHRDNSESLFLDEWKKLRSWGDSNYHDELFEEMDKVPGIFADSRGTNDWARAIFYLQLAKAIDAIPVLSSPKMSMLNSMGISVLGSQHAVVTQFLNEGFRSGAEDIFGRSDVFQLLEYEAPPILEFLVKRSAEKNISIITALNDLRQTNNAKRYREFLTKMRVYASNLDNKSNRIEYLKIAREIKRIAKAWGESLNNETGISYVPRKIKLSTLPLVGKILEIANMSEIEIKDLVLWGVPGHLAFCASWYEPKFKFAHIDHQPSDIG